MLSQFETKEFTFQGRAAKIVYPPCAANGKLVLKIKDRGRGIEDIAQAMEPLFTTGNAEERSGMGFTVMEAFMDKVKVASKAGMGTTVTLTKYIKTKD